MPLLLLLLLLLRMLLLYPFERAGLPS